MPQSGLSNAVLVAALVAGLSSVASAQDIRAALSKNTRGFTPVTFQIEIKSSMDSPAPLANYIFKPTGPGPFPAVVLQHTCGGVGNSHMRTHGIELLSGGYVVLLVDSFGPRGLVNCRATSIASSVGALDAYAALEVLSRQPFVDKARIYQAGYSWGGVTATLLASPQSAEVMNSKLRFRATVSHYSTCVFSGRYPAVTRDTDRPLLILLGERDRELPPSSCFPLLEEMKGSGAPVKWYVYPGATHGWDKEGEEGNGYIYNNDTAKDATRRMLEFFGKNQ